MNKKIILIIIGAALFGAFFGSLFSATFVRANPLNYAASSATGFFQDLYNQYLKNFLPSSPASTTQTVSEPVIPYSPVINYEQAIIKAVESASPAVVSIIISKDVPIIEQCPYNPFSDLPPEFQQFFSQQFEFNQPCQKGTQKQEVGGGSGFIISSDGLIATNKHVVLDEKADYTVFTNDGKKYSAQVLARDPARDLAIVKIKASDLPVVKLGDSSTLKLGQTAIAIGNALGEFRNTVSVGVVSGLARSITASGGGFTEKIEGLIQTDAAINQGNSGGPLLNLKGEVIGINVAMASGAQNIGFAIPINQVKQGIESVKRSGRIISPYLGVRYLLVTPELAQKEKLPVDYGVLVKGNEDGTAVLTNSPADKAGLKAEDIILGINGEKISTDNPLASIIQRYSAGDALTLKILRAGKEISLQATLEERPKNL